MRRDAIRVNGIRAVEQVSSEVLTDIIGNGRSAVVYRKKTSHNDLAVKVFTGDDLGAKIANLFWTGGDLAYRWCEDAVMTASLRRNIVADLSEYWFGDRLKVARSKGVSWNPEHKAFQMETEYVEGRHAALHHPFSKEQEGELSDLVLGVMKPLQSYLQEAGLDGLTWQAGLGNPTAVGNFMKQQGNGWTWVDLESGIPALVPISGKFFSYYIPKSFKHRTPLFDDVDGERLKNYLRENQIDIKKVIGVVRYSIMRDYVDKLEFYQNEWKSLSRLDRSVTSMHKKGKITGKEADYYIDHSVKWYSRLGKEASLKVLEKGIQLPGKVIRKVVDGVKEYVPKGFKFLVKPDYRRNVVENYLKGRIGYWKDRKMIDNDTSEFLEDRIKNVDDIPYMNDLVIYGGLKVGELGVAGVSTALFTTNQMDLMTYGLIIGFGGATLRVVYSGTRLLYDVLKPSSLRKFPGGFRNALRYIKNTPSEIYNASRDGGGWAGAIRCSLKRGQYAFGKVLDTPHLIALGIGWIPQWGNLGYPVQMTYSGSRRARYIGRFLTYDAATIIGRNIPIIGGENSKVEHGFNHVPSRMRLVRNREPLYERIELK